VIYITLRKKALFCNTLKIPGYSFLDEISFKLIPLFL
jgi:hypothetical protein